MVGFLSWYGYHLFRDSSEREFFTTTVGVARLPAATREPLMPPRPWHSATISVCAGTTQPRHRTAHASSHTINSRAPFMFKTQSIFKSPRSV